MKRIILIVAVGVLIFGSAAVNLPAQAQTSKKNVAPAATASVTRTATPNVRPVAPAPVQTARIAPKPATTATVSRPPVPNVRPVPPAPARPAPTPAAVHRTPAPATAAAAAAQKARIAAAVSPTQRRDAIAAASPQVKSRIATPSAPAPRITHPAPAVHAAAVSRRPTPAPVSLNAPFTVNGSTVSAPSPNTGVNPTNGGLPGSGSGGAAVRVQPRLPVLPEGGRFLPFPRPVFVR
jgi:translation initiation factor IF-2